MFLAFNLKSARLETLILRLNTTDIADIRTQLEEKSEKYQHFANKPLILDVNQFNCTEELNLSELIALFLSHNLRIIALRHDERNWSELAQSANLIWLNNDKSAKNEKKTTEDNGQPEKQHSDEKTEEKVETETVSTPKQPKNEETRESEAQIEIQTEENTEAITEDAAQTSADKAVTTLSARPTVVINTPVRTGQQVYAERADLIVLGAVSEGAEIIADGNIHVYAPMRGRALAGESGDKNARIFLQSMQAELISIAGIYRVFEQDLPPSLHRQPVQIELQDDRLAIFAIDAK